MKGRLPMIFFLVGLLTGDLTYRLTAYSTFQGLLLIALVATGILYMVGGSHELVRDAAVPLAGGFAASGIIKWVFTTLLA